jgi:hypothetical protein
VIHIAKHGSQRQLSVFAIFEENILATFGTLAHLLAFLGISRFHFSACFLGNYTLLSIDVATLNIMKPSES